MSIFNKNQNNQNTLNQQQIYHQNLEKLSLNCDKIDKNIRRISQEKARLPKDKLRDVEKMIEDSLKILGNEINKMKNMQLTEKYGSLMVLWSQYKFGMELKSKEEEEKEAAVLLDNIMGKYNEEHYGVQRGRR